MTKGKDKKRERVEKIAWHQKFPKKIQKKLTINKSTIAHLGQNTMNQARAGAEAKTCSVFPCIITESCTQVYTCQTCTCDTCPATCTCNSICSNGGPCCE